MIIDVVWFEQPEFYMLIMSLSYGYVTQVGYEDGPIINTLIILRSLVFITAWMLPIAKNMTSIDLDHWSGEIIHTFLHRYWEPFMIGTNLT